MHSLRRGRESIADWLEFLSCTSGDPDSSLGFKLWPALSRRLSKCLTRAGDERNRNREIVVNPRSQTESANCMATARIHLHGLDGCLMIPGIREVKLRKTPSTALGLHPGVKSLDLEVNDVEINIVVWREYEIENNKKNRLQWAEKKKQPFPKQKTKAKKNLTHRRFERLTFRIFRE